jgi:Tfp pilus assembly protein PilF
MPNNVSVLNNLAYLLAVNDRQLSRALTYGKNALDLQPDSPSLMDTYGFVLYKTGQHKQALIYLSAAAQRYQQSSQHVPYQVYEHIGLVREHLGQKTQAREAFQQALKAGSGVCPRRVAERLQGAVTRLAP